MQLTRTVCPAVMSSCIYEGKEMDAIKARKYYKKCACSHVLGGTWYVIGGSQCGVADTLALPGT